MKPQVKILTALSGGVDSAVAAELLVSQGYDVTAAYMINYDGQNKFGESCWVPEYQDAVRVAASIGIPILKFDFTKEYQAKVLEYMFSEYEAGRTPNPDVLCNKYIKFGFWLDKARELGFEYLATGHYARTAVSDVGIVHLIQAKDENKDQTYFLHQLTQQQLSHALFPVGEYTKPEVRELAKKFNLPVAEKEESMGICFVGEVPMKEFLQTRIKPTPGKIVTSSGEVLGVHEGLAFYTIGQRSFGVTGTKSLAVKGQDTKPLYVVGKNFATNELVVGFDTDPLLYKKEISLTQIHWISGQPPTFPLECEVRLRHRQPLQKAVLQEDTSSTAVAQTLVFNEPQRAPTPGQFAVFYKDGECLGGGVIETI